MTTTKDAIDLSLAQEFVLKAHFDLDRVAELLAGEPVLVNAVHDWGGGDWETALGAAAHMGRRDIATLLLEHGAHFDLFAAAMLGQLEIVRAVLRQYPEMRDALGAHGIPLINHAIAGGEPASEVARFLEEAGARPIKQATTG